MTIHFVCAGNIYRSRFAEAYAKSKEIEGLTFMSSGVNVNTKAKNLGPVAWEAMRIMKNAGLLPYLKQLQTQTTPEGLNQADKVIFFGEKVLERVRTEFDYAKDNYEVWEIADIVDAPEHSLEDDIRRIKESEATTAVIREKVDDLLTRIR